VRGRNRAWGGDEDRTDGTVGTTSGKLIPPHGGYRELKSYQMAEIVYDATVGFCDRFIDKRSRTHDQMVQAARSGKQNIAEGSQASGTSKRTELKLVGVSRASLEELLLDCEDFLRQRGLPLWGKDHPLAQAVRRLAYAQNRSYTTYRAYSEAAPPEVAANALLCLIHQANYLLDQNYGSSNNSSSKRAALLNAGIACDGRAAHRATRRRGNRGRAGSRMAAPASQ
jgi:restriction system protein